MQRLKLYTIWRRASKELTQVKGRFGLVKNKKVCADGAIIFYLTKGEFCDPSSLNDSELKQYMELKTTFEVRVDSVTSLNDDQGWSFADFAKKAKELNL